MGRVENWHDLKSLEWRIRNTHSVGIRSNISSWNLESIRTKTVPTARSLIEVCFMFVCLKFEAGPGVHIWLWPDLVTWHFFYQEGKMCTQDVFLSCAQVPQIWRRRCLQKKTHTGVGGKNLPHPVKSPIRRNWLSDTGGRLFWMPDDLCWLVSSSAFSPTGVFFFKRAFANTFSSPDSVPQGHITQCRLPTATSSDPCAVTRRPLFLMLTEKESCFESSACFIPAFTISTARWRVAKRCYFAIADSRHHQRVRVVPAKHRPLALHRCQGHVTGVGHVTNWQLWIRVHLAPDNHFRVRRIWAATNSRFMILPNE